MQRIIFWQEEGFPVAVSAGSDYSRFLLYFKQFHHAPPHTLPLGMQCSTGNLYVVSNYGVVKLFFSPFFAFGLHTLIKPYIKTIEYQRLCFVFVAINLFHLPDALHINK